MFNATLRYPSHGLLFISKTRNLKNICLPTTRSLNGFGGLSGREKSGLIDRLKHPPRGGQNLSARYERLERSLRGKELYSKEITDYTVTGDNISNLQSNATRSILPREPMMFHGFTIPEAPRAPEADECCMSGCAICVYDLYNEALEAYDKDVASLRFALVERGIAQSDWPSQLQKKERKKDVVLSAFEQMELELAMKHRRDVDTESKADGSRDNHSVIFGSERAAQAPRKRATPEPRLSVGSLYEALSWIAFSRR